MAINFLDAKKIKYIESNCDYPKAPDSIAIIQRKEGSKGSAEGATSASLANLGSPTL
jgi:hypothetical protein